jgi:hypothetical protein
MEFSVITKVSKFTLYCTTMNSFKAFQTVLRGSPEAYIDELAMLYMKENLESLQSFIADRNMTQSIAEAVQIDGPLVVSVLQEEETPRLSAPHQWKQCGLRSPSANGHYGRQHPIEAGRTI